MRRKETLWRRLAVASRAFRRSWQPQTLDEWDAALDRQIDGLPTYSGAKVNENLALNLSAVWCAVLNIAVTVASLPLKLYRHSGNSRQPYPTHSLYGVLQSRPNTEMDAFIFREIMQRHLLLWGNAYAEIRRNPQTDRVLELWPLNPARMEVHRKNGKIIYVMKTPAGKDDDVFSAKQIFHLKGPGYDGRVGYSVVSQMAKQSMGIALASDMHAGRVFDNFATPRGVLKTGQKFHDREKATKNIRESWQQVYGGPQNTGKVAILEEGMEFEALSMSPEDLQLLATRTFNVQEIARWFNIPVMKLQEHSHSTYSNVSELQRIYAMDCIRPWLERWERAISDQLLNELERKTLGPKHTMAALLRGDLEARNKSYAVMRQHGALNANEWRAFEEMNPIDGMPGETYLWQLNMIPAGQEPVQPSKEVPPEPEEPEEKSLREVRSARSFHERKRISEIYKVKFEEVAKRFVKRDRQNILKITRAQLGERNLKGFQDEVNTYYNGSTDYVKRNISSVYIPFAAEIYVAAAEEVNADSQLTARYNRDVQIFIDKITDRHIRERSHEITKLAETAQSEQKDPEEAITARLDEWDEKYPAKFAEREAVGGETGLASQVYFSNGFRTRWVTMGDSCPYCNSLNGRVVSEGGVFLAAGEPFEPSGAIHGPLVSSTRISHPPAHGSCDCGVMASV